MDVLGIDFTSRPRRAKPITCLHCTLEGGRLTAGELAQLTDFAMFEAVLMEPGEWIAGIDFPFGQSRTFIETIGWPQSWEAYVLHAESLGREGFRAALTTYRNGRDAGDKEHRRETDIAASSISPQKLYGVPVGLMFFEGAPRLIRSGATVPHMRAGDPNRIVVEAYPGVLARALVGRKSYKNDTKKFQNDELTWARHEIFDSLKSQEMHSTLGFSIDAPRSLADDPSGDNLDALLCAVQAAWSWTKRHEGYGAHLPIDSLEGWIADPTICRKSS